MGIKNVYRSAKTATSNFTSQCTESIRSKFSRSKTDTSQCPSIGTFAAWGTAITATICGSVWAAKTYLGDSSATPASYTPSDSSCLSNAASSFGGSNSNAASSVGGVLSSAFGYMCSYAPSASTIQSYAPSGSTALTIGGVTAVGLIGGGLYKWYGGGSSKAEASKSGRGGESGTDVNEEKVDDAASKIEKPKREVKFKSKAD